MKAQHTVSECNKKLVVLLDKLQSISETDPLYRHKVADAKMLAQELSREREFLGRVR